MPPFSRRQFLKVAAVCGAAVSMPRIFAAEGESPWERDRVLLECFDFPPEARARLSRLTAAGLLDISTIAFVADEKSPFRHLGWPVAAQMPDGRAAMIFARGSGHHSTLTRDEPTVGHYALHSLDGTRWLPPVEKAPKIDGREGMQCVNWAEVPGKKDARRFVAVISGEPNSVHLSDDGGLTWRTQKDALKGLLNGAVHCGPNLMRHLDFGLIAVFGQEKEGKGNLRRNYLVRTLDAGEHWQERVWENPERASRSVEPAGAVFGEGHMVLLAREFHESFGLAPDGSFCHTQHVYRHTKGAPFEKITFDTRRTNIAGNGGALTNALDTPDVVFNPVSGRVEMLQSHRWGPAFAKDRSNKVIEDKALQRSSLNLWSISPAELLGGSAQWRFDGTIIERTGYSCKGNKDGLHPGGSIVEVAAGVQKIFVYAGWRRSPSGLFCITRTLDTGKLRAALLS